MYTSEDALDMVLNSVALYFIVEVDDNAVFFNEYKKLKKWIDVHYDDWIDDVYQQQQVEPNKLLQKCYDFVINIAHFMANRRYGRFIFLPIAFVAPIYMLVCF